MVATEPTLNPVSVGLPSIDTEGAAPSLAASHSAVNKKNGFLILSPSPLRITKPESRPAPRSARPVSTPLTPHQNSDIVAGSKYGYPGLVAEVLVMVSRRSFMLRNAPGAA